MRPGALLGLAIALYGGEAAAAGASAFDGAWDVTTDCPASSNGDPAFFYAFKAQVSGDVDPWRTRERGQAGLAGDRRRDPG